MRYGILSAILTTVLFTALASAQHPPAKDLMIGKKVFRALQPDVKAELKVTAEQEKKIFDAFEGSLHVDGERIGLTITPDTDLSAMEKAAMKVFDEAQTKRLHEIWLQVSEGLAAADEEVAKTLGLGSDQKTKADKLIEEGAGKLMDLFSGGHDQNMVKQAAAIRADYGKKVLGLLTEDQRKAYDGMLGKPFKRKGQKDGAS